MNSQLNSVGTYQLFGGYNPIAAAVEEYYRTGSEISSEEETQEVTIQKFNETSLSCLKLAQYIPQIPMKRISIQPIEENESLHQTEVSALKEAAKAAVLRDDYPTAMLHLKKICEMTVYDAASWKMILAFAKIHFRLLVPTICCQIMIHCNNPTMKQEAKTLLTRSQLSASA